MCDYGTVNDLTYVVFMRHANPTRKHRSEKGDKQPYEKKRNHFYLFYFCIRLAG